MNKNKKAKEVYKTIDSSIGELIYLKVLINILLENNVSDYSVNYLVIMAQENIKSLKKNIDNSTFLIKEIRKKYSIKQ